MNKVFLALIAISPALAIVLYLVFLQQQKLDVKMNNQLTQTQMQTNNFEADFAKAEADFADTNTEKQYYVNKAKKYEQKNKAIEERIKKQREKLAKLNKKADEVFKGMDDDFNKIDDTNLSNKDFKKLDKQLNNL